MSKEEKYEQLMALANEAEKNNDWHLRRKYRKQANKILLKIKAEN